MSTDYLYFKFISESINVVFSENRDNLVDGHQILALIKTKSTQTISTDKCLMKSMPEFNSHFTIGIRTEFFVQNILLSQREEDTKSRECMCHTWAVEWVRLLSALVYRKGRYCY